MFMRSAALALAALSSAPAALAIKPGAKTCGADSYAQARCIPIFEIRDGGKLKRCLEGRESDPLVEPRWQQDNVTIINYDISTNINKADYVVKKLTFPEDGDAYSRAKFGAHGASRYPAGILYAQSEEEVIIAVNCAREAGYQISPRGRGHSWQGLGSMDGYLVVDMSLMCDPNNSFNVTLVGDDDYTGPKTWILGEDQKVLGSITSGAGCTNAVMLAYNAGVEEFKGENGGIYMIGSCPSVGIVGYATGGGQGDATPYTGLGIDDVLSYRIVTSDGVPKIASATENEDLYWYLRGGGSGIGVVLSIEGAVIESIKPPGGKPKYTSFVVYYKSDDQEKVKTFLTRLQDFLVPDFPLNSRKYLQEIKKGAVRYGGQAVFDVPSNNTGFNGIFLGSEDELVDTLDEYGLLDDDTSRLAFESDDYGKIMAANICKTAALDSNYWYQWFAPTLTANFPGGPIFDICQDLGISDDICSFSGNVLIGNVPLFGDGTGTLGCESDEFLTAFVTAARDPQSFVNRPGFEATANFIEGFLPFFDEEFYPDLLSLAEGLRATLPGGILVPRVDPDVLLELANLGVVVTHFAHGAATIVPPDATGYANRAEYMLLSFAGGFGGVERLNQVAEILVEKVYGGDPTKLRGYYNYMNPPGSPNWREYYFGKNYQRLSEIKAKYDETNMFGNPLQVEPAVPAKQDYFPWGPKGIRG